MTQYKSTFIQNIYYMLSYAFQALRQENYKNMAVEKFAMSMTFLPQFWQKELPIS